MLGNTLFIEYLNSHPKENHDLILQLHNFILDYCPDCSFTLDHFIPTYSYNAKIVLRFHVYKNHIGLFPGERAINYIHPRLSSYRTSKKAIQIPRARYFPFELVEEIIDFNKQD